MDGRGRLRSPRVFHKLPALFGHPIVSSENRLRRGSAETDHDFRPDCRKFRLKPRPARPPLGNARLLVNAALAPLFEFKMLDGVSDVNSGPVDTRLFQCPIEQAAGRSHERASRSIFLVAGLFADKHDRRRWRAFTEHRLRGALVEIASTAALDSVAQDRERPFSRNKISCRL